MASSSTSSSKPKLSDQEILTKLADDFHKLVSNKDELRRAIENFLNNTFDELTLGIIFDLHRKYKIGHYEVNGDEFMENGDDDEPQETHHQMGVDIFGQSDLIKIEDVTCPNCSRPVSASKFAPHLGKCMGMGRLGRSRNASTRASNTNSTTFKDRENASFSGVPSDDEDDIDWNTGSKRGKKKKRNGTKKTKTLKKGDVRLTAESTALDLDVEDEELANLKELMHDHSNSSSPTDSASSNQSTSSKKREKSKSKKNKRDRSSPSVSAD